MDVGSTACPCYCLDKEQFSDLHKRISKFQISSSVAQSPTEFYKYILSAIMKIVLLVPCYDKNVF